MSPAPPGTVALAVTELGAGPAVVILHGLLGSSRNWHSIGKALAEDRKVILADLRNHGGSPWADAMDYPAMAADVARLIRERAGGRAAVVGHSMGGKVAMTLALSRPELVERLVVVDIAPVPYAQGYDDLIRAMLAVPLHVGQRRADVDAALRQGVPDPALRGFLLQNLETADGRLSWQPNLEVLLRTMPALTGFPAELAGRTYAGTVDCLRGARSDYVDPAGEATLRGYFPAAVVATVADAGHWPHAERPALFQPLLERALSR